MYFNTKEIIFILDENNNPWFKAKNIAEILTYSDHDYAINKYIDEEDKKVFDHLEKNTIYINKTGLYYFILSSQTENAKILKIWIKNILLPLINQYIKNKKKIQILKEQLLIQHQHKITKLNQELFLINKQIDCILQKEDKLKEYNNITEIRKPDIIYIMTNNSDIKRNIFKVNTTTIINFKKQLEIYNTNVIDKYYYIYYKKVYNGPLIEKKFNSYMYRFNVIINNKINRETYQLYLPDLKFWLIKIIKSFDELYDNLNKNYVHMFINSKNKKSIASPIILNE